jgi:DHA2 family methylenomycin A resistance protein-like MFS transporter
MRFEAFAQDFAGPGTHVLAIPTHRGLRGFMVSVAPTQSTAGRRDAPRLVLLATCLGVLMAQLDTSVVNLALAPIGTGLQVGVSALQWVVDAYNLVYATLLLTGGALADLYGRRRIFVAGIAIFALGSLVCGLAPNATALIAGRVLTGLGAALEFPTSLAILTLAYDDPRARAHALGVWASCNGLAFVIGPTTGGLLVDAAGWRSIFLLTVPIAALTLWMTLRVVSESVRDGERHLDPLGQVLAIAALGSLAFGVIEGPHWGWHGVPMLVCAEVFLASLVLFIAIERSAVHPLVPFELFGRRAFSASLAVGTLMTFGIYALLFLIPLYLQSVEGASAFTTGLELVPLSLAFFVVSQFSGRLVNRLGPRVPMAAGMALVGLGLLVVAWPAIGGGTLFLQFGMVTIGVGLGLNTAPVMGVAVASVSRAHAGIASGLVNTARMVGATLGVAVLGAVFAAYLGEGAHAAAAVTAGLRAALTVGGAGELLGALVALLFVRRDSLHAATG